MSFNLEFLASDFFLWILSLYLAILNIYLTVLSKKKGNCEYIFLLFFWELQDTNRIVIYEKSLSYNSEFNSQLWVYIFRFWVYTVSYDSEFISCKSEKNFTKV